MADGLSLEELHRLVGVTGSAVDVAVEITRLKAERDRLRAENEKLRALLLRAFDLLNTADVGETNEADAQELIDEIDTIRVALAREPSP